MLNSDVDPSARRQMPGEKLQPSRFSLGLRAQLILTLLPLTLAPLITVAALLYGQAKSDTTNLVLNQLTSLSRLKEKQIRDWTYSRRADMENLALAPDVAEAAQVFLSASSSERQEEAAQALAERFQAYIDHFYNRDFSALLLVRADTGQVALTTENVHHLVGQTLADDPYFQAARAGPVITPPRYAPWLDATAIKIVAQAPILNSSHDIVAILMGVIPDSRLNVLVEPIPGLGETGRAYIVTQDGYELGSVIGSNTLKPDHVAVQRAVQAHKDGHDEYPGLDGDPVIGIYSWLDNESLALLIEQDAREAYTPLTRLRALFAIITAAAILVSLIGVLLVTQRLTQPIRELTEGAQSIASGNWNVTVAASRNDEIGVLSKTFNLMAGQIREVLATLEQRLADLKQASQALQESEEAARRSEARYRDLFENSPVSLWEEDFSAVKQRIEALRQQGVADFRAFFESHPEVVAEYVTLIKIVDVNHATLKLFKASDKAQLIRGLEYCLPLEAHRIFLDELVWIAEGRTEYEWEGFNYTLTGERIDINLRWSVAPGYEDTLAKALIAVEDITRRKQVEEELNRHHERLEELVKERTAELAEAKERSEAANRAKSVFLANMSHELRTPLNAVLGFSRLMRNDPEVTPKQAESLDIISRSGEHLLGLINNVLDISKIESGRVALEESTLDLHQLVHELRSLMHVRAEEKELSFSIEQSPDLPQYITVDAGKLRQVLLNLIGNALKYTSQGGVILRAGVAAWEAAQRARLRFEVEDTGPGIHAEDQARIFIPFVQLANQPSGQAGSGLGLAISKQYIELMGGQIGVTSEPDEGAVFYFEIPAAIFSAEEAPIEPQRGQVIGLAPGQPHYRLLIVEDQPENRRLLREMLKMFAFEVCEAANGKEALAQFEQQRPDLIWMDIRMPVMDGLEATRRIKATPAGAHTRIIALTAHALEEERRTIIAAGCDDFIRKPYRDTEIFDMLSRRLGVRFVYAGETTADSTAEQQTEAALAALSGEMLAELDDALNHLDVEAIDRAIDAIRSRDDWLAGELATLARDYQFSPMLRLIERGRQRERGKNSSEKRTESS